MKTRAAVCYQAGQPLAIEGGTNVVALGAVVASVVFVATPLREIIIVAVAGISWTVTPRRIHEGNGFTFHPIAEVAALFLGIFVTLVPALELLRSEGGQLAIREPWQFFWATGVLSAFLDNAPTYLAFLAIAQGLDLGNEVIGVPHPILAAISLGAVFFGANSYIGNAPNFMVRSIAERAGVAMPSFFGYVAWSTVILVPLFLVVTLAFV